MKHKSTWVSKVLLLLVCIMVFSVVATAATEGAGDAGVAVSISTPKSSFKAGEDIGIRVSVVNYTTGELSGRYTIEYPSDIQLEGASSGELTVGGGRKKDVILGNYPDQKYIFSSDDVETEAVFDGDVTVPDWIIQTDVEPGWSYEEIKNEDNGNNNQKPGGNQGAATEPDSGTAEVPVPEQNNGSIVLLILGIALALILAIGLVWLFIKRRGMKSGVALFLCVCTVAGLLPAMEINALEIEQEKKTAQVSTTITVDGKECQIVATVEYTMDNSKVKDPYLFHAVDGSVVLEAEDCYVDNDYFIVRNDEYASNGKVVYAARGEQYNTFEIDATLERQMGFDFVADTNGTYNLWIRGYVRDDHVWVYRSMGGEAYRNQSAHNNAVSQDKTDMVWNCIGSIKCEEGEVVTVRLRNRVTAWSIDKIMVTSNQAYTPQGEDAIPPLEDWYAALEFDTEMYADPTVYPEKGDHPRLFFHEDDVADIRKKLADPINAAVTAALMETAGKNFDGNWDITKQTSYNAQDLGYIECKAFFYAIFKNHENAEMAALAEKFGKQAIVAIKNIHETFTYSGNALRARGHVLYVTALVYDWCYDLMTQKDKARLATGGQAISNGMEIGFPPVGQEVVAGHGAEKQLLRDWLSFSIAVYDEYPSVYELVGGRFFEEYVPARNKYWSTAQYHHQGLSYGCYRFVADIMGQLLIYRMADVSYAENPNLVYDEGIDQLAYQWLYTQRPDERLLKDGDSGTTFAMRNDYNAVLFYAAMLYKDPVLFEQFLGEPGGMTTYSYAETLTPALLLSLQDMSLGTESLETKSYTKYFGSPYGLLVARTNWDMRNLYSNGVLASMKIQESYLGGHQNREAGSFQLYYKGSLTGDTGHYGTFGTDHDTSYQSQSVSKNTLSITSSANPNGYQISEADTVNPGNSGKVIGVEFGNNIYRPEYSYISGDVAKAYDDNVTEAIRSMLFLNLELDGYTNTPGAFIVFDQITTKETDSKKSFLLHSLYEPTVVNNKVITITNKESGYNGRLTDQILYVGTADKADDDYSVFMIGGEGKEFWTGDFETGRNHPNSEPAMAQKEAGWGRVEISTKTKAENQTDYMLNVMYVSKADGSKEVIPATLVRGEGLMGAQLLGHVAMFNMNANNRIGTVASFTIPQSSDYSTYEVNVAGMKAGTWVVSTSASTQEIVATEDGGMLYFTAPAGTVTLSYKGEAISKAAKLDTTAPEVQKTHKMYVNGLLAEADTAPYFDEDMLMVPLTPVMSSMSASVDWRGDVIAITYMNDRKLTINGKIRTSYLNGQRIKTKMKYSDGELWVPLGLVQELIKGYGTISWSDEAQMLVVTAKLGSSMKPIPETYLAMYPSAIQVADVKNLGHVSNNNDLEYGMLSSLDGNIETRYVGSSDPEQGLQYEGVYDLGSAHTLDKLAIIWNSTSDKRQYIFDVMVSLDGVEYTTVLSMERSNGTMEFQEFDFDDVEARYVKIKGYKGYIYSKKYGYTEDNITYFSSISEILFLGPVGDGPAKEETPEVHQHAYKNKWTTTKAMHWHDPSCGHYVFAEQGYHVYDEDSDTTCNTCGYVRVPHYEHTRVEDWSYDLNKHWREPTCECYGKRFDEGTHTYDKNGVCTVCHAVDTYKMENHKVIVQAENTELLTKPGADPLLGDTTKPAVVVQDNDKASGGKVVLMNQAHTAAMRNYPDAQAHIKFRVQADKTATYYVWAKVYMTTAGSGINVFIDDDERIDDYYWNQSGSATNLSVSGDFSDFVWVKLSKTYEWTKGQTYDVCFRTRNALIRIDEFYITADVNDPYPHVHGFETSWSKDENYHWYASTCGCEDRTLSKDVHVYDNHKDASCNICGYTRPLCTDHTYDDKNICTKCGYSKPIPTENGKLVIQAESAKLSTTPGEDMLLPSATSSAVVVQNNAAASGGKVVLMNQRYTASLAGMPGAIPHISFVVNPDQAGTYHIWVKMYAPSDTATINVFVNDESNTDIAYWTQKSGVSSKYGDLSDFVWVKLDNTYQWKDGEEYIVRFRTRDSLVRIDEFYVTTDANDPYPHVHTYSEEWSKDATHHWHDVTCGCADVTPSKVMHIYDGKTDATCNTCGYERELHLVCTYGPDGKCTVCGAIKPYETSGGKITVQAEDTTLLTQAGADPLLPSATAPAVVVQNNTAASGGKVVLMNQRYTASLANNPNALPHMSFAVKPDQTGTYYIWVKMYNPSETTGIQVYVEDKVGTNTGYNLQLPGEGNVSTYGQLSDFVWVRLDSVYQWDAGEQYTINIRTRDTLIRIDEFYITADVNDPFLHTHSYSNTWSSNAINHWKYAVCGCENLKAEVGMHTYQNGACTVCGREEPEDGSEGSIILPDYETDILGRG